MAHWRWMGLLAWTFGPTRRTDRVAMDSVFGVIDSDLPRQAYDGVLRGDIAGCADAGDQAAGAAHVDDPASSGIASAVARQGVLLEELGGGVFAAEEDTADVGIHGAIECVGGSFVDAGAARFRGHGLNVNCYSCVVDHAVDLSSDSFLTVLLYKSQGLAYLNARMF